MEKQNINTVKYIICLTGLFVVTNMCFKNSNITEKEEQG